jgi:hypothetical protein
MIHAVHNRVAAIYDCIFVASQCAWLCKALKSLLNTTLLSTKEIEIDYAYISRGWKRIKYITSIIK